MIVITPSTNERYIPGLITSAVASCLFFSALLVVLMRPALAAAVLIICIAVFAVWSFVSRTMRLLGLVLAIMPIHFLPIAIGKFYGVPGITVLSICTKELPLLFVALLLLRRNGFKPITADWLLLGFVTVVTARSVFGGEPEVLLGDLGFVIPYMIGRACDLGALNQRSWSKWSAWIVATLSVLGMVEVFAVGDAPRKLLFAALSNGQDIGTSFAANGFEGLRASSTMTSPLAFAALCMVALIIWWVYSRNPIPPILIAAGMVCTLTRSAIVGTSIALFVVCLRRGELRRLLLYSVLAIACFVAAIPVLGLSDFVTSTTSGEDASAQRHQESFLDGLRYITRHPFGSGAGSVGYTALQRDLGGLNIENTYLTMAAEYGIVAGVLFTAFVADAIVITWRNRSNLGCASTAILIGFATMMLALPMNGDLRLGCWIWFPVGLAIRDVIGKQNSSIAPIAA